MSRTPAVCQELCVSVYSFLGCSSSLSPTVFVEAPIYLCVYASVSCQLYLYTLCLATKSPVTHTLVKDNASAGCTLVKQKCL